MQLLFWLFLCPFIVVGPVYCQSENGAYTSRTMGENAPCSGYVFGAEVYQVAEVQPSPKDGMNAWYRWLEANNRYLDSADRDGIALKVYVEFVVNDKGTLVNPCVVKGAGEPYDQEAIRLIEVCPLVWEPGIQKGMKVHVRVAVPVFFTKQR